MKLPCKLAFEGSARNKAEALAAAALVQYLVETGHVDKDLSPNTVLDQEVRCQKIQQIAPVSMKLLETSVPGMQDILTEFETIVANAPHLPDDEIKVEAARVVPNNAGSEEIVDDIMTGRRLTS